MRLIPGLLLTTLLAPAALAQQIDPASAWRDFTTENGSGWTVEWNAATGTPSAIFGQGLQVAARVDSRDEAAALARNLLRDHAVLLGKGRSEFVETSVAQIRHLFYVIYGQRYSGLDVLDARVDVRINERGVVSMFGSSAVPIPAGFRTQPLTTSAAARVVAERKILGKAGAAGELRGERLVIHARPFDGLRAMPVLAWEIQIDDRPAQLAVGKVYVDALKGTFIEYRDEVFHCACGSTHVGVASSPHVDRMNASMRRANEVASSVTTVSAPPIPLTGTVMAWTNTGLRPDDALQNIPLANVQVTTVAGSAFTDANGKFSIPYGGTSSVVVSATLAGKQCLRVRVATGTQLSASSAITPGTPGTIQFGTSTMGDTDRSQTTTYHFTDDIATWIKGVVGNHPTQWALLDAMNPQVNIESSCNAYYSNYTINFYNASTTCNMTAYQTVVQHEWGHGLDHAFGGINRTDGLSEGWADVVAILRSKQPIVGSGFRKNTTPDYVRTALNTKTYPTTGSVHAQGEVWMGWVWDVRLDLIARLGAGAGHVLTEQIVVPSIVADAGTMAAQIREVFLLDDDDGNLNNGTPNYVSLEKASLKRTVPYPKKVNPNAGTYTTYGTGCAGSGKTSSSCASSNGSQTANGTLTQNSNIFALSVPIATGQTTVTGFELFTRATGASPLTIATQLYLTDSVGRPVGSPVRTGTMTLGTTGAWYKTTFSTPYVAAANQGLALSYTSVASGMMFPIMASGSLATHFWHPATATTWNGPFNTQRWGWKLNCAGGTGAVPVLTNVGVPEIGTSFQVNLSAARENAGAIFIAGASNSSWNGIPLPLDMTILGAPGCDLLASASIMVGVTTTSTGTYVQNLAVPNNSILLGANFFNQYAVKDVVNPLGLVFSNGGAGKIGKQ